MTTPDQAAAAILARLERQLHRGFGRGSEVRDTSTFRLYVWPRPEPFYRNRAIPLAPPSSWAAAVRELVAAFAAAGREPRLEFFAELWPGLAPALDAAGFRRELEGPVLVLDRAPPPPADDSPGSGATTIFLAGETAPELMEAAMAEALAAFGMEAAADPGELAQLRRDLAEGATLTTVRLVAGRPVAGASLVGVGAEAELAGVWTSPGQRRRGHARAVCAALLRRFLLERRGELAWLSAGDRDSEALYRGLGFARVGTQLNYALAAADAPPQASRGGPPAPPA